MTDFEAKIKKLIKEKLGIENVEIERALTISKEERNYPSLKITTITVLITRTKRK